MDHAPNTLTPVERLQLHNQFRILAKVDPANRSEHDDNARIVAGGFEAEYPSLFGNLSTGLDQAECDYVVDVLDMYYDLKRGYDALEDKDGITEYAVTFNGFDGNNESGMWKYTQYLKEEGRFGFIEKLGENSHGMGTAHSPEMIERYQQIRDKKIQGADIHEPLTADEIRFITGRKKS